MHGYQKCVKQMRLLSVILFSACRDSIKPETTLENSEWNSPWKIQMRMAGLSTVQIREFVDWFVVHLSYSLGKYHLCGFHIWAGDGEFRRSVRPFSREFARARKLFAR